MRARISRRLPTRIQERLLADRFRADTDWQKTTAFAITALFTSFIRVNLRGREPRGVVAAGAEYNAVLDRLVHGAHRIELKGESMRKLRAAKAKLDAIAVQ